MEYIIDIQDGRGKRNLAQNSSGDFPESQG